MREDTRTMKLLFYKAETDTLLGKLIAYIDGSPFSHVELVVREDDRYFYTVGCHWGRGGVKPSIYPKNSDIVIRELRTSEPCYLDIAMRLIQAGTPYAAHKMPRTLWSWWPCFGKGLVCSSFIATIQNLPNPDSWGVAAIYNLTEASAPVSNCNP